jgi:transposase
MKATEHLAPMVKRILKAGVKAQYVLMDSWFTMPANIIALREHLDVIGMVKKTPKILYTHDGRQRDLETIYQKLRKRSGRAKILASTTVTLKDGKLAKIVFVRHRKKKDWLALLSTDIDLSNEDVVRIYGKRWDIEVLFKMAKQHLNLTKEIQCRDFDALIAHTTIVFMRYLFISYSVRMESDNRSFGDLFYTCCDEVSDISFVEALFRLMNLAAKQLREMGTFCEKTASAFFDAVMHAALSCVGLSVHNMGKSEI